MKLKEAQNDGTVVGQLPAWRNVLCILHTPQSMHS